VIIVNDSVLKAEKIKAQYIIEQGKTRAYVDAVSNVSIEIYNNEILGIAGESGCGKSTFIRVLYGYVNPPLRVLDGHIILNTREGKQYDIVSLAINKANVLSREIWWRHMSYVPQAAQNVLNPTTKIKSHFIETLKRLGLEEEEALRKVKEHLSFLGLSLDVLDAYPHQLSGGMRQRVVIALATVFMPEVVFADEPTSALDVVSQKAVLRMLRRLQEEYKNTVVIVSHDMDVLGVLTDRISIMYAGKIVEIGDTEDIFRDPLHPYTRALIQSLPRIGDKTYKSGIPGTPPDLKNPPSGCRFHPRCPYAKDICRKEEPPMIKIEERRFVACWLYSIS